MGRIGFWPAVVSMKEVGRHWSWILCFSAIFSLLIFWIARPVLGDKIFWQQQVSPGELTAAHTFLEIQCDACHVAMNGVPAQQCIVCHSNQTNLLQRQDTAFHSSVGTCVACHREHQGERELLRPMDHLALARIGLRQLGMKDTDSEDALRLQIIDDWLRQNEGAITTSGNLEESTLQCAACHANQDRHQNQFGADCAACHGTTHWMIADFRHPSANSRDCAQCHQAPPSHYMEHFIMISMSIAQQEHAQVDQCFLCHRPTQWNDIRGTGLYDHH